MGFQLVHPSTPSITSDYLQYNCQIAQANSLALQPPLRAWLSFICTKLSLDL